MIIFLRWHSLSPTNEPMNCLKYDKMSKKNTKVITNMITEKKPLAIWGSIARGVDSEILEVIGVRPNVQWNNDTACIASS